MARAGTCQPIDPLIFYTPADSLSQQPHFIDQQLNRDDTTKLTASKVQVVLLLDGARTGLVVLFFIYASWSDYKSREVSDIVWLILAPISFSLTFTELFLQSPSLLISYGICFGLTSVFAIILFYSGGFGGADSKALMCLALALPFYPENLITPSAGQPSPIATNFFPISVFSNSILFAALTAVALLLYNVLWRLRTDKPLFEGEQKSETIGKKMLVLITGYKASITKLKEKWHVYPMEDIEQTPDKEAKRKLIILPKDEGRDEIITRLDQAIKTGTIGDKIWATPGLPMLIFMTAGLIVALFVGDVIWIAIRLILR